MSLLCMTMPLQPMPTPETEIPTKIYWQEQQNIPIVMGVYLIF
jgi:hypothetical protein